MCSYDGPNGIPSCGNKALQVDVLQKEYLLRESILSIYTYILEYHANQRSTCPYISIHDTFMTHLFMHLLIVWSRYGLAGPIVTDCGAIPGMMCSLNYR